MVFEQGSVVVGSRCWQQWGWGACLEAEDQGRNDRFHPPRVPLETPVRPHLSAFLPPAAVLTPGWGLAA